MLIDTLGYGGGAERQFAGLATALHNKSLNVKVLAYYDDNGYQNELREAGIDYKILSHKESQLSKFKAVRRQLVKERPDIVISYKDAPNNIACMIKASGAKWRLIVSDRNTLQNVSRAIRLQYGLLYRFADFIVPNSYAQKSFIDNNFRHLSSKVRVITNFTDTDTFTPASTPRIHAKELKKTILTVARIAKQKNTLTYIEAAKALALKWRDKAHIVWYGAPNVSEEEYVTLCRNKIIEYGIQDFFEFKEPVVDIADVYRSADIFCLPSNWEGFPNALCEAMASGLAVCASDICDNRRIISDGINGLLFNQSLPEDIALKIDNLLSMEQTSAEKLISNARSYALDNMSVEAFTEKYMSLINH